MIKRLILTLLLLCPIAVEAAPGIFQYRATTDNAMTTAETVLHIGLPNHQVGHTGNTILVAFRVDNSGGTHAISSVSDTAVNTYTQLEHTTVGVANFDTYLYAATNINSTINNEVKVTFSSASVTLFMATIIEVYNVAASPIDTHKSLETASGTTHNAGSINTTNGDIVVSFCFQVDGTRWDGTTLTPNTGYTLRTENVSNGSGSQDKIATGAAENPAFTTAPDATFHVLTVSLKSGSTTAPSGIYILGLTEHSTAVSITSFVIQWPTTLGNLLIARWNGEQTGGAATHAVASITDTKGNTWTSRVQGVSDTNTNPAQNTQQILDTGNATTSTGQSNKLTVSITNQTSATFPNIISLIEVVGAETAPITTPVTAHTDNATQASWPIDGPTHTGAISITPAVANGLVIFGGNQFGGTAQSGTGGTTFHSLIDYGSVQDGGGTLFLEDGFLFATYNTTANAITLTISGATAAPGGYDVVAAAYRPNSVAATTPCTLMTMGIGKC